MEEQFGSMKELSISLCDILLCQRHKSIADNYLNDSSSDAEDETDTDEDLNYEVKSTSRKKSKAGLSDYEKSILKKREEKMAFLKSLRINEIKLELEEDILSKQKVRKKHKPKSEKGKKAAEIVKRTHIKRSCTKKIDLCFDSLERKCIKKAHLEHEKKIADLKKLKDLQKLKKRKEDKIWPEEKVLQLIHLCEKEPCLWNTKYKFDNAVKETAWTEIQKSMEMDKSELKKKFQNLKREFCSRVVRKKDFSKKLVSKWKYYEHLKFYSLNFKPRRQAKEKNPNLEGPYHIPVPIWNDENVLRFIGLIEKQPCLWSYEQTYDQSVKEEAWQKNSKRYAAKSAYIKKQTAIFEVKIFFGA